MRHLPRDPVVQPQAVAYLWAIMSETRKTAADPAEQPEKPVPQRPAAPALPKEIGGTKGPEPTRYGDWEHKGRCTDF